MAEGEKTIEGSHSQPLGEMGLKQAEEKMEKLNSIEEKVKKNRINRSLIKPVD